jgi:hypothetical protein
VKPWRFDKKTADASSSRRTPFGTDPVTREANSRKRLSLCRPLAAFENGRKTNAEIDR